MTREPHDPLAAHLDALGAGLADATARGERRRRRALVGGGAGVAVLAAGLGALVALPGAGRLDPVAEARAALGERGDGGVLHYVVSTEFRNQSGLPGLPRHSETLPMEVWTATSGEDRWRVRFPADGRPKACNVQQFGTVHGSPIGPELVEPTERAQDETTSTTYSPFSRIAVKVPRDPTRDARPLVAPLTITPVFGTTDGRDPVSMVREALRDGDLRDAGPALIGGRPVRKLVGRIDEAAESERRQREADTARDAAERRAGRAPESAAQASWAIKARPTGLTYFVDAQSFAPVQLRVRRYAVWTDADGDDHWRTTESRDHYSVYERLPDTPANTALLAIAPPAGAEIVHPKRAPANIGTRPAKKADDQAAVQRCEASRRTG